MQYRKVEHVTSKTQNKEQDEVCVEFLSKFLTSICFCSCLYDYVKMLSFKNSCYNQNVFSVS